MWLRAPRLRVQTGRFPFDDKRCPSKPSITKIWCAALPFDAPPSFLQPAGSGLGCKDAAHIGCLLPAGDLGRLHGSM